MTSRRAGRPTRESAAKLDQDVREAGLALFLEDGYDGTSMDAIAAAAGTTKATLYARYPSKAVMFREVLDWAISRRDWPVQEAALPDLDDLPGALRAIATAATKRARNPDVMKLVRIAMTEASQFPDLARQTLSEPVYPRQRIVEELLEKHAASGEITLPAPAPVLAELFLGLVSSAPAHLAAFGIVRPPKVQAAQTDAAVSMFLLALRP